jgi:hypothetical protein
MITNAPFGNHGFHSQGGQMIISHEEGLKEGKNVAVNLLWWRSGKLQQVVNLTLAAETQSLSKGIGDLMWMTVLFKELQTEDMMLRSWSKEIDQKEILVMASQESEKQRAQAKEASTVCTVEGECSKPAVSQRCALERAQR